MPHQILIYTQKNGFSISLFLFYNGQLNILTSILLETRGRGLFLMSIEDIVNSTTSIIWKNLWSTRGIDSSKTTLIS